MQSFFARIDKAAWREQQLQTAEQLKEPLPARPATPPPKRNVGRPKLIRPAEAVLAAAAAAAADTQELSTAKRGKYTRWFSSPYIHDILHAHVQNGGSARRTVTALQRNAPDDRFARLSHSTVASWSDAKGALLEAHRAELEAGHAQPTSAGLSPALRAVPGVEDAICDHLLQLRKAGMPLNSHVVRWAMQAVLEKHPTVLEHLSLSQQYICKWVRSSPRLQFRWRARTTAASKLPDDWEEQGIHMAQRMAAFMQLYHVSMKHTKCLLSNTWNAMAAADTSVVR